MQIWCQVGKALEGSCLSVCLTNFFLTLHASLFSSSEDCYFIELKKKKKKRKGKREAL